MNALAWGDGASLVIDSTSSGAISSGSYGYVAVGYSGSAALTARGVTVSVTNTSIGEYAGSYGSVSMVSGTWTNTNSLWIGKSGSGVLILSGNLLTNSDGFIGQAAGSYGSVEITSGTWTNTGVLEVGVDGKGKLAINGGCVVDNYGYISVDSTGYGAVVVNSGTWKTMNDLHVGYSGSGSLTINSGVVPAHETYVGTYGGPGSVVLNSGTWSGWAMNVGTYGTGTVTINGGLVDQVASMIGYSGIGNVVMTGGTWSSWSLSMGVASGGIGTMSVTGGSVEALNGIVVGENGTGTLNLDADGVVGIGLEQGGLVLASGTGSVGTLNFGTGGTSVGTLYATEVYGSSGVATVNINSSGRNTFGQIFAGNLSVNVIGSGLTIFTGENWYTGPTLIRSGTLQIGDGGTSGELPGNAENQSVLVFNRSDIVTASGVISGTGRLIQSGPGTLILTGNNVYTGVTAILSGTLQVGDGGASGWISDTVVDNGVLVFNRSDLMIYSGGISGTGGLIQGGTGELVLTGSNTYSGPTTVVGGTLAVNGSIAGDVTVLGGILGGSGVIHGNVSNQSLVSPGNSPGTLTINGNYDQGSSGALLIQIASASVFDHLVVTGTAFLGGGLVFELLDGYTLRRGDRFSFLTAGALSGTFAASNLSSLDTGTPVKILLAYTGTDVTLEAVQGRFADVGGFTPNQRAVAEALDRVVASSKVSGLVDLLDSTSNRAIPSKLERIVPTSLVPMFDAIISFDQVQTSNLEQRMQEIRNGAPAGFSASGLSLVDPHGTRATAGDPSAKQAIGKDGKALAPAPIDSRWGFFVNGSGEWVDEESSAIARGAEFATSGITTGADYRWGDHAAFGLTAGYANTLGAGYSKGPVRIDSGKLGAYGTLFGRGAYLNGALGGGFNDYATRRDSLGGTAWGDSDGTDFNAMLGGGWNYTRGCLNAGPLASLRYSWVGIDAFDEHGSLAPLKIGSQNADSLKSALGMQVSTFFPVGKTALVSPQLKVQWLHEYLESARGIGASFLPGGDFTVFGPELGRDSLQLDVGASLQLSPRIGVYAFYIAGLGRSNSSSQSATGGVQVKF